MSGSGGASGGGGGTPQVDILALGVDTGPLKQAEGEVAKSLSRVEGAAEGAAQAFDVFEKSVQDAANAARQGAQATKTLEASTEGAGQAAREAGAAQAGLTQKTTEGATASRTQTAALKALEAELAEARRMMIAMGGTIADMNKAMEALQKQAAGAGKGLGGTAGAAAAAAGAYGLTTREIQQLLPQINDVFTQLSMGQGLLMVATAQGPQIIQQLGGFGNTLSALGRFMGSFIQSATGMSVALAAIGVAAIAMSESTNRSLSTLSQRLRMTRDDYAALSVAVTETAKRVAASSSMGGGDARDAGRIIASQSRFSGNEAELESLIRLSGRLARAMGTEVPAAAEVLARAIDKPADAARRLASEGLRTMDEALVRNVIRLENQGKTLEAQQAVIGAYRRALDEAAKTPLQQSLETLGNAFQRLGQALRPVVDAIGSVLARVLAVAVDWTAKLVDGLARLIELLSDNKLTQFFGMTSAPREPVVVAPQDRQQTEAAVRSVREINPRMLQRQALQDRITGLRSGLSAANGEERGLINAGVGALQEQLRGLQGPMDQYLKGLNQQVVVAQAWDGANRAVAEALIAVENAGGGAAAQAVALGLVRQRLRQEFANENATLNRNTVATLAQAEAQAGGARAAEESRIAAQAYLETLSKYQASDERFEQALRTRIGLLLEDRDARVALRDAQNITSQEQQLELLRTEIDLVGTSVVQRERELAVLRERQRIMSEGGDPENDRGRQRLANAAQIAEATQALQRQQSAFTELSRIGEQAFDRIGEAITRAFATGNMKAINFRNIAKAVFSEVLQWMLRLAVINPLKNAFMGGNNPSIMDVASVAGLFGGGGGLNLGSVFGGQAQAATPGAGGGGLSDAGSSFGTLRQAYNGLTSPGGLGSFFPGGAAVNTGFGGLDGVLNTALYTPGTAGAATSSGFYAGTSMAGEAGAFIGGGGGASSLSFAQALGPLAAIGGGAYGVYSGLQRGGIGGYTSAAGGAVSAVTGMAMLGSAAGLLPALGALGPIGLGVGALLAIGGALLPGQKASGQGQLARTNLNTGEMSFEGLGGRRFSQGNRDAATNTVNGIADLARQVGDKLGGARIGGNVAVGVTNGTLYLDVHGQKAQFSNDADGAKQLAETAARMVLNEFRGQGTVQGDYGGIIRGSNTLEELDVNLQWYEKIYKAFDETSSSADKVAKATEAVVAQFNPLIDKAHQLGLSSDNLVKAREREWHAAKKAAEDAEARRIQEIDSIRRNITAREQATAGQFDYEAALLAGQVARSQAWAEELRTLEQRLTELGNATADTAEQVAKLTKLQGAEYWANFASSMKALDQSVIGRILRANGRAGEADRIDIAQNEADQITNLRAALAQLGLTAEQAAGKIAETQQAIDAERQARARAANEQIVALDQSVISRILRATGRGAQADMADFEASAAREVAALARSLDDLGFSADVVAKKIIETEQAIGAERVALQKRIAEEAAATQKQAAAEAQAAWERVLAAGQSIRGYIDAQRANSGPGGVSTAQAFTAAQGQFGADLTLARGGDQDALWRITSTADRLLDAAQKQYASGVDYQAVRSFVLASLETLPAARSYDALVLEELRKLGGAVNVEVGVTMIRTITEALNALPSADLARLIQAQTVLRSVEQRLGRDLTAAERDGLVQAGPALRLVEQTLGRNLTAAERDGLVQAASVQRNVEQALGRTLTAGERATLVEPGLISRLVGQTINAATGAALIMPGTIIRAITETMTLLTDADRAQLVQAQTVLRTVEQRIGRNLSVSELASLLTNSTVVRVVEQAMGRDLSAGERAGLVAGGASIRTIEQTIGRNLTVDERASLVAGGSAVRVVEQAMGRSLTAAERSGLVQSGAVLRTIEQAIGRDLTANERASLVVGGAFLRTVEQAMGRNLTADERAGLVAAASVVRAVEQRIGRNLTDAERASIILPESVTRSVTQRVETTETIQISRSIDDKLSGILNALLVIGREEVSIQGRMLADINLMWRRSLGEGGGLTVQAGAWAHANGSNIVKFAQGGVFDGPVMFPMRGGTGMLGEAGPEAIMPLARGPDGKLGVKAAGAMIDLGPLLQEIRDLRREVAYFRAESDAGGKRAQRTREAIAKASEDTAEATATAAQDRGAIGRRRRVA